MMDKICMYLRKSRADEEAEKHGEGETLAKHKKILLKFAESQGLNIVKIREEIVSGESLVHRPQMLKLLKEVEKGMYNGVLCMDMDRLGRGNMQEQGLILETFKKSKTKIITTRKTYDLQDEFDEEYSEFEAFMARKELKIINRRLQRGRIRSVEDGNYIGTLPPYGYEIYYEGKNRTLIPHPQQAPIVKIIFDLYVNNNMGCSKIANKLNQLGYKTYTGKKWSNHSVLNIIKNEVYTGRILWKKTKSIKSKKPNQDREVEVRPKDEWINVPGKHDALISEKIFRQAQEILKSRYHIPYNTNVSNPLAGLIRCQICNSSMVFRTYTKSEPHITCYKNCGNKSSKYKYIEQKLLRALMDWLKQCRADWIKNRPVREKEISNIEIHKTALKNLKTELTELQKQKDSLHNLLERGIYDTNTYLTRYEKLTTKIKEISLNVSKVEKILHIENNKTDTHKNAIPKVEKVLSLYNQTNDPSKKNKLLKTVLDYAEYIKKKHEKNDQFTLILYPKLPR